MQSANRNTAQLTPKKSNRVEDKSYGGSDLISSAVRKNQDYLRGITNSAKVPNKFGSIFQN